MSVSQVLRADLGIASSCTACRTVACSAPCCTFKSWPISFRFSKTHVTLERNLHKHYACPPRVFGVSRSYQVRLIVSSDVWCVSILLQCLRLRELGCLIPGLIAARSGDQDSTKAGDKRPHSAMSADNVTTLISAARQLEDIYTSQNVDDLDRLASGHVTLHKDSMMLMSDIQGIDNLKKYYQV